jgi:hypothetical protein
MGPLLPIEADPSEFSAEAYATLLLINEATKRSDWQEVGRIVPRAAPQTLS